MADKILNGFDIWITAQGVKSRTRLRSVDNISLEGIASLRLLILELAIQGKLVPQNLKEGNAHDLLTKTSKEKELLLKTGKIKRIEKNIEIRNDEAPFSLPLNWCWVRLSDYYDVRDGTHDSPKPQSSGFPLVTSKNLVDGKLDLSNVNFISEKDHLKIQERSKVERGDILFAMIGSIGNPVIVDTEIEFSIKNVALFKYYNPELCSAGYLKVFLDLASVEMKKNASGGVQSFVSLSNLRSYLIPLPPLAEQHRIVAKVDELMALCDELEQQETHHLKSHQLLVETLLGTLTRAADANEFQHAWKKLYEHFDDLFTTEDSIDQLKQTILQLAVMGKLVPQNPNDEPASELLKKVNAQQKKLIEQKSLRLGKATDKPVFLLGDIQFPESWVLCKADQIFFVTKLAGFEYTDHFALTANGEVPVVRAQNVRSMTIDKSNLLYIDLRTSKLLDRCSLTKKSLLITFIGAGIGDVATFEETERWHLAPNVAKMEPFDGCESDFEVKFFNYFLSSPLGQREIFKHLKATAQPSLSMGTIRDVDMPLPPANEQKRIVTKVEELFALCDRLKERIAEAQRVANQMVEGVVV